MGRPLWRFIIISVSLLLDPTFGDVLVQQGYDQSIETGDKSGSSPNYVAKSQTIVQPQQTYVNRDENPMKQLLQYQHKIQQQQLQGIHQQERDQLLQIQHQQLQHPAVQQQPQAFARNDVVGTTWGARPFVPSAVPAMGGLRGGRLFSLGPFGLNSFSLGGLGTLTPILMSPSPYHPQQMTGSGKEHDKSIDESSTTSKREKRDVRDGRGDKFALPEQINVAENSALNKKFNKLSTIHRPRKSNEDVVGNTEEKNGEENVGGRNLLDPLGLVDRTEDLIEDLKHGHVPNPLDILTGGGGGGIGGGGEGWNNHPGSWLRKQNTGNEKFEEHIVSQPHGYQSSNQRQSQVPMTGGEWKYSNMPPQPSLLNPSMTNYPSWSNQQSPLTSPPYGMITTTQTTYGQPWNGRSNGMGNEGGTRLLGSPNPYNQPINGMINSPHESKGEKSGSMRSSDNGEVVSMTGSGNSGSWDPSLSEKDPRIVNPISTGKYSPSSSIDSNYNGMRPIIGTLYNPMTGSATPAALGGRQTFGRSFSGGGEGAGRNDMVGNILSDAIYDIGSRMIGYEGTPRYDYYNGNYGMPGRSFDLDDLFDNGYNNNNHFFNNGNGGGFGGYGYDRFYGNGYDDAGGFYANRGGYPIHHQRPYRPHIY